MQKKEWQRNILIGCVVAALFFGWWLRGFLFNWRFRLFSSKSWEYMARELEQGWQPSSKSDWIFLLTLLFAIPVFLYLWYLCAKIRWRKLLKTIWKWILWPCKKLKKFLTKLFKKSETHTATTTTNTTTTQTVTLAPTPLPAVTVTEKSSASARPMPVARSGDLTNVFQSVETPTEARPTFNAQTASSSANQTGMGGTIWEPQEASNSFENQPLDEIQLPQREPVVEDVPGLFQNAGYHLISDVATSLLTLNYVAVCSDKIYAILVDKEAGDWLAEEEPFNGEAPLWFSEVDHRVSPIYELKKAAEELKKKIAHSFPNMPVVAFMIEEKGNIINSEEMMRVWKELDVVVARTDIGGLEDLPTVTDTVKAVTPASMNDIETLTKLIKGESNG